VAVGGVGDATGLALGEGAGVRVGGATVGDDGLTVAEAGGVTIVSSPPQAAARRTAMARAKLSQPTTNDPLPISYLH